MGSVKSAVRAAVDARSNWLGDNWQRLVLIGWLQYQPPPRNIQRAGIIYTEGWNYLHVIKLLIPGHTIITHLPLR